MDYLAKFLKTTVIAFVFGAFVILGVLSFADLTTRETGLLGTILTLLAIVIGGAVTHIYAQSSVARTIDDVRKGHTENLRTYALKAAEKVNNLSKELTRLTAFLEEELEASDYHSPADELLGKEARIESAIHILQTLRSVNDTALSDWRGVIGDELNEQRENEQRRTEEVEELLERFSALEAAQHASQEKFSADSLKAELEGVKRDIKVLVAEVTGQSIRRAQTRPIQPVNASCPTCKAELSYRQKPRPASVKALSCKSCAAELISEFSESTGFQLRVRQELPEHIVCPACAEAQTIDIDEWPSASTTVACTNCGTPLRISRASGGLRVAVPSQKERYAIDEPFMAAVKNHLPAQPWPKQIHRTVAEQLNAPAEAVQKAIQQLILRGVVQDQIDGQVCTTEEKLRLMREAASRI